MAASRERTQVCIVGGGPAGLMLSHLLAGAGIESIVLDTRSVEEIENTHRAGILEHDSVRMLVDHGVDRVLRDGHEHQGIDLRFDGASHRIDFNALIGKSAWLYPQTEVFKDLYAARAAAGADLRFGLTSTEVLDCAESGLVSYTDGEGQQREIESDVVVGSDGSRSACREHIAGREQFFREYPFAWFGVMVQAPPSAPELIYARSPRGFALISQRTDDVQRMYFQCDPGETAADWSDDRIWEELQTRLAGHDGFTLQEGPVLERTVLAFRSFVQTPMHHGALALAGDAGHTVPPTGAKGLNLALSDVRILAEELERAFGAGKPTELTTYTERATQRVWKAQHFSYWMTRMLHRSSDSSDFDERRQLAELHSLVDSVAGSTYLAEGYTGWPTT